jgi:phosphatidylglycerol---prolipoprotein diacylglyceryl transferase
MYKELFHLYGPFSIYSYGLFIAIGLCTIIMLMQADRRFIQLHIAPHFNALITVGILSGIVGGRVWYTLTEPDAARTLTDFLAYWQGGFSILGCVIGICITLPIFLYRYRIPVLPFLDFVAIYAPLVQSISRIGCLCAGCCYGLPSNALWAIKYSDPDSSAPIGVYLHPTQLYSSFLLLIIFCLMYWVLQYRGKLPGQLLGCYLMLSSMERFFVDFWRDDQTFFAHPLLRCFSVNQWLALAIIAFGIMLLCTTYVVKSTTSDKSV